MYSKKKLARNIIIVVAILIVLIILVCSLSDITKIYKVLVEQTNYVFILAAVGLLLVYALTMQLSLTILIKDKAKDMNIVDCMLISGTEFFFNGITPFSSGGQPFQAYALKRKNMKITDSTSVLLVNFLVYQIVLNLISVVCIILYYGKLKENVPNLMWLIIMGFTINLLVMVLIILIGCTKFMGKAIAKLIDLLCKIKFIAKLFKNKGESFQIYVDNMQQAFKEMSTKIPKLLGVGLIKTFSLLVYYSIPFVVFLALGVEIHFTDLLYIVCMTSFALTITAWIPTPGASGGVELAFNTLFATLITTGDQVTISTSGMLLWRLITYYLLLIYSFVLYLTFERRNRNEDRDLY